MRISRTGLSILTITVIMSGCGGVVDTSSPLPMADEWSKNNPQPTQGVPLHLVVDFTVGGGFKGETARVEIDGNLIVEGLGEHRPSEHCNWYGPYDLVLTPGEHEVVIVMSNGPTLTETFQLTEETSGFAHYIDPTYGGYDENPEPHITWDVYTGPAGCA